METDDGGLTLALHNKRRLQVEKRDELAGFVAFSVAVPDLDRQAQILMRSEIAFGTSADQLAADIFGLTVNFVRSKVVSRPT